MSHIHTRHNQNSLLAEGEKVTPEQLETETNILSFTRAAKGLNRRRFLGSLGVAGAAAGTLAATGALTGCYNEGSVPVTSSVTTPSILDVLNFALNLEYLEASFYNYISTGAGLSTTLQGTNPGTVTGGAQVTFTSPIVGSIAAQLATDETEHVAFLQSTITALGGTPVGMPSLNLAALGAVSSDATFLALARALETVGVSAYAGGAQYLTSNTTAITYAAQILDTEAQHEGFLRELCITMGVTSPAVDSQDQPPTASAVFNTSPTTGLNPVRTTSQVLQIVYGAVGQTGIYKGGFFPNGLNGAIFIS